MNKRRSPTEKQVENLKLLDENALIQKALDSMFSLNRRVKKIRDNRNSYKRASFAGALTQEIDNIYDLKDKFVSAMVATDRAKIYFFENRSISQWNCGSCDNSWFGSGSTCFECGDDGIPEYDTHTWYLIDCGDKYTFHQPKISAECALKATKIPPHDPNQPQREIPDVGLTINAQKICVQMAIDILNKDNTNKQLNFVEIDMQKFVKI